MYSEPVRETEARQKVKAHADSIVHELFQLDRRISSAAYFLPAFEVRNLTAAVDQLRAELQKACGIRLPHVPFAFSDPSALVLVEDPLQQVCDRCILCRITRRFVLCACVRRTAMRAHMY